MPGFPVRAVLGATVLVLVAACTGESGDPSGEPSGEPSSKPTRRQSTASPSESPKPPRQRLRAAQLALSRTTGGAYDLAVGIRGVDDPFLTEKGRFDVVHEVLEVERTVPRPEPKDGQDSLVFRMRSSAEARFLQMDDWGAWEGCWIDMDSELTSLAGVDLSAIPNIAVPVSLVLDAKLAPQNRPALAPPGGTPSIVPAASTPAVDEITVLTDGLTALQMFGVSGSVLLDLDPAVARARVPVSVSFFERYPDIVQHVRIDGAAAEALRDSGAELDRQLTTLVRSALTGATFHQDVIPVEFVRPAPDRLLPAGATRDQTCPANLD